MPIYYPASNVTIPIDDILGDQTLYPGGSYTLNGVRLYTIKVITIPPPPCPCPPNATCTCTATGPTKLMFDVTELVAPNPALAGKTYNASVEFVWFGAGSIQPSNATLFGGDVKLKWFTSPSEPDLAYLNIWTNSTVPATAP